MAPRPVPLPAAFLRNPIAHRGYHSLADGRPENSMGAFRAAVEAGYGIELDLQQSADGQAMVFHDDDLDRLTERSGLVKDHIAAELGAILLRGSDEPIPTLAQLLAMVAGRVPLLIEIKENLATMGPTEGRLEQATADALASYSGPVAVMSFNPHCVMHMARLAPHIPRGLTTEAYNPLENVPVPAAVCDKLRDIPDYDTTGSSFISHQASDLARLRVAELKAQGASILCWTIRSPKDEAKARTIAQNITFESYPAAIPA
ncbi:MAG: glycerophosphodiester phosphodiesterase family protein [Albidovulum sp.]